MVKKRMCLYKVKASSSTNPEKINEFNYVTYDAVIAAEIAAKDLKVGESIISIAFSTEVDVIL